MLSHSGEKRGIWYNPEILPTNFEMGKAKLRKHFELYKKLKITEVFLLAKSSSDYCFYDTHIGVKYPGYDWDVLKTACEIATELGISVHAWFCAVTNPHLVAGNPTLAMVSFDETPSSDWANPVIPDVKNYILNMISEIITNYNVKGIHLDYIRYPGANYSYDDYSRTAFQSEYGFDPKTNPNAPQWLEWRCRQITNLVNDARTRVKNYNPNLQLSAAVFVPSSSAKNDVCQNWADWLDRRLIDILCPMAYTDSTYWYETYVKSVMTDAAGKAEVLIGTGIWLYANYPDKQRKEIFLTQINTTRKYNATGWVLFRDIYLSPFVQYFAELEPKPDVVTQAVMAWLFTLCLPTLIPVISEYAVAVKEKAEELLGKLWSELRWE